MDQEQRLAKVEAQVDALTRALHLLTVVAGPTSQWLDATMKRIDEDPRFQESSPDCEAPGGVATVEL